MENDGIKDIKFDFKKILDQKINETVLGIVSTGLESEEDKKAIAGMLEIFNKHGVGSFDAMMILMETGTFLLNLNKSKEDEDCEEEDND